MHLNLFWQFHFTFLSQWLSKKCSSLVLLTSHVKFQVYSRLKLTQRCSSPAGLVSNLNLLKFMSWNNLSHYLLIKGPPLNLCAQSPLQGSKGGAVVRSLASHNVARVQLNPGIDAICGLSLLLVLSLAPRGFSPGTPVFPFQIHTFKFQFNLECTAGHV